MRSGNADLGAGLTQTRGKRVDEAKHLAAHQRDNINDMWLRVGGTLLGVLGFCTVIAFLIGTVVGWVFLGITGVVAALIFTVLLIMKKQQSTKRDAALAELRKVSRGEGHEGHTQ